jgi:hypothetical protein
MADVMFSGNKKLDETLDRVRNNRAEAEKFSADPKAYLEKAGVDTTGLKFGSSSELSEGDLEQVAGGRPSVCGSIGAFACASVGG